MLKPYRIATLCYLFDKDGRVLLLHRRKSPNLDLYSPIGGKLEQQTGESPAMCASREIHEEVGLQINHNNLHLTGIVSEQSYENHGHWLMFCYEVTKPVEISKYEIDEGTLEWFRLDEVLGLNIPETDKHIIWPLFIEHRSGFFAVHIDCSHDKLDWIVEESVNGKPK